MTLILSRDFAADIEIRSDGTGRTVHGIVVPYGQVTRVADADGVPYDEEFVLGVFERDLTVRAGHFAGVKLLFQHDRNEPIGRADLLREDAAGLYGEFRVARTVRGDEVLELVRSGVIDSFSVGFIPQEQRKVRGVVRRTQAALREGSLVTFPAYAGAAVTGVRALDDTTSEPAESTAADEQRQDPPPPPDQDQAPATPLGGLTPAQRRERLHPTLKG